MAGNHGMGGVQLWMMAGSKGADQPRLVHHGNPERSRRIAEADAVLNEDVPFIPIARPLRWSLVATRLRQWQPNSRAWHPLNRRRIDTK